MTCLLFTLNRGAYQLFNDWYVHFTAKEIRLFIRQPAEDALEFNAAYLKNAA